MENDFQTASTRFWTTIWRLRRGTQCIVNTVWWRRCAADLDSGCCGRNTSKTSSIPINVGSPISGAEVVRKLLGGRAPGVDEFRPEFLKALDVVGLSWLTRLCSISGAVPLDWQTGGCVPTIEDHTPQPSW